jgi:hypothetical protein
LNNELATYVDHDAATATLARRDFESVWNRLNVVGSVLAVCGPIAISFVRRTAAET